MATATFNAAHLASSDKASLLSRLLTWFGRSLNSSSSTWADGARCL
jgi:hypothetical protein